MKKAILIMVSWFIFSPMAFAAIYNDETVELFKVEDLADPLNPITNFFTISETKGYKIICPTGTIQKGLGFWAPNDVETFDSGEEKVMNAKVTEQPELLCQGAPGFVEKKPKFFVVMSEAGDEYYLQFPEKANYFYSPGCLELIDALGVKTDEATEIDDPEAILTVLPGNDVNNQIFNINCFDGTVVGRSMVEIYKDGETDGAQKFNNNPQCEGGLEPPTQNRYPGDPRANERYNNGFRKAFINAKATYILNDYECKIQFEELFKEKGREAFVNSSPTCPDMPDISGTVINEYPHEGLNTFYNAQFELGFNEAKQEFQATEACLEGIEIVAANDMEAIFLTIQKSCTDPMVKPDTPQKYTDKPNWNNRYTDAFSDEFGQLSISWKQDNCAQNAHAQGEAKGKQYYVDNPNDYYCKSADTAPQLNTDENPYKDISGLKEIYENGFEIGFLQALKEFKEGPTCISAAYSQGRLDGKNNYTSGNHTCTSWPGVPQVIAPFSEAGRKQKYIEGFENGFENAREEYVMGTDCNKYTIIAPKLGEGVKNRIPTIPELPPGRVKIREGNSALTPVIGSGNVVPYSLSTTIPVTTLGNIIPERLAVGRNGILLRPEYEISPLYLFQPCKNIVNLTEWINPVQGNVAKLGRVVPFCIRFDKNIKNVKVYIQEQEIVNISEQSEMVYKVMPKTGKFSLRFEAYNQRGKVDRLSRNYQVEVKPKNEFPIHNSAIGTQSDLSLLSLKDRYIVTWRGYQTENPSCQVFTKILDRYGYTLRNDQCLFSSSNAVKINTVKYKDEYYVVFVSDIKAGAVFGRLFKADGNPIGDWNSLSANDGSRIMTVTSFNNGNQVLASVQNTTTRKLMVKKYQINTRTGAFTDWNLYTTSMVNAEKMYIGDIFNFQNDKWGVFFTSANNFSTLMLRRNTELIKEINLPRNYGIKGLALNSNRIVAVFEKPSDQNMNQMIALQQFDSNGNYIGNQIEVGYSKRSTSSLIDPNTIGFDIAKISENLLDVVSQVHTNQNKSQIYRTRYNTSEQVRGQVNRINDTQLNDQILPRVASMNEGSTIIGWTTYQNNNTKPDLSGKLFDPNGIPY